MDMKRIIKAALMAALVIMVGNNVYALKAPHIVSACSACHAKSAPGFKSITGFTPLCLNNLGCHRSLGTAPKKILATKDASRRFGSVPADINAKNSSHAWKVPPSNKDAGVTATPKWGDPGVSGNIGTILSSQMTCTRCHRAHGEKLGYNIYAKFLRANPKGDDICLQCHAARNIDSVRGPVRPAGKHYSHPVQVSYSTAKYNKSQQTDSDGLKYNWADYYEASPTLTAGYNASARPRLYTTVDNSKSDAVVCSSCHGPIHSADSNPYTLDNLSTYSRTGQYSTSAGNLLRGYPMSKAGHQNNLCKSCHKVSKHKTFNCGDCHEPHKKDGDNNLYLIRTSIMTPYGKHSVQFQSTSRMAKVYKGNGIYSSPYSQRSTAICQVCHRSTAKHRAYSSAGMTEQTHKWLSGDRFEFCPKCHPHANTSTSGAFKQTGGCTSCHNAQTDVTKDATTGKHIKHVGSSGYTWSDGAMRDERTVDSYGFSCGRCHSKWSPYTGNMRHQSPSLTFNTYSGDAKLKGYTADVGFKRKGILPNNTTGSYTYGATGGYDDGGVAGGSKFRYPNTGGSDGQCRNIYCHGQFYNGYTANDPTWRGTQTCGKCHGATAGDPPGRTGSNKWGAHDRHIGSGAQQYGAGSPNFRCNACHFTTSIFNRETAVDSRINHVDGRVNVLFNYSIGNASARYGTDISGNGGYNNYSSRKPAMFTKPAYASCKLTYCHSDGSRVLGNYSVSTHALAYKYPNWSSTRNFTTTVSGTKRRCARCHGSSYSGITAAMPGYASRAGKGNSHVKHVVYNGFMCNVCHSLTTTDSKSIADTTKHVNKQWNVDIISRYGGTYSAANNTCSNVKCHGGRTTPAWGTDMSSRCQDCHYKSTAEGGSDEGYKDSYAWKSMTSTNSVPRIYSGEWKKFGHGASANYPSSNNPGANKTCTACHKASGTVSHQGALTNNPYRLITSNTNTDVLCKACHGTGAELGKLGVTMATVTGIQQHSYTGMGGWGDAVWQFKPKCIDCHDPHGDKNRSMIHSYINYSGSDTSGKRTYDLSQGSGFMTFSTIGAQMRWSSYVKSDYSYLCQRCHNLGANIKNFNKAAKAEGGYKTDHNSGTRCTDCHKHKSGFKGMSCNGCHKFPPVLSGKHSFHIATTVSSSYVAYDNAGTTQKYAYGCGKCHNSGSHYVGVSGNYTTEVVFDSTNTVPKNSGSYAFGARSSIDQGNDGPAGYSWTSTKGTCRNLYCHGQFFGGYSGNDPNWYNNGTDDPQTCGKCHGAVKNSSNAPNGGAHNKHVTTYSFKCRFCHRETSGAFDAYTVIDRKKHADGITQIRLYTTESRVGKDARYGSSGSELTNVTTNTNPATAPTYRYCKDTYCHSSGQSQVTYALPNYTAFWGYTGNQRTSASSKGCSLCHGNKTYAGITAAMPDQGSNNSHKKHVIGDQFKCNVCHANVVDANGNWVLQSNHVNKFKNISIITRYKTGQTMYSTTVPAKKTCKNIKCHGGRVTPLWGNSADCRNCHLKNTAETTSDEGFRDAYAWKSMTSTSSVPKIYSTEWQKFGHGKYSTAGSGGRYPSSGNKAAGKVCNDCHKASVPTVGHSAALSGNQYRLYTTGSGIDFMCKECHTAAGGKSSQATTRVLGHTQAELAAGNATWQFTPKCIDCHDPHGDKNRYMVQQYVNYSGSSIPEGRRTYDLNPGTQMTFSTIGAQMAWSSYVRNTTFDGMCQRCHNVQNNMTNFRKGLFTRSHNAGNRCTSCHKHSDGFRGSGCGGCHNFPPALSGKHSFHVATTVTSSYVAWDNAGTTKKYAYGCGKCHNGGTHYAGGSGNYTTEVVFDSTNTLPKNSGTYAFGARSSIDQGADGAGGYSWTSTKGTCRNLYCHGQFFGGYSGNDPNWYNNGTDDPQTCGKCHGAVKNSSNAPNGGAHNKHVTTYSFKCRFCHRETSGAFDAYTVINRAKHANGITEIRLYTTESRVGKDARYGSAGSEFINVTTNTNPATAPTYRYCKSTYCHSSGQTQTSPYALPNYTAFWGYTGNQRTPASSKGCSLCHGNKTWAGITSAMPDQLTNNSHRKHVVTEQFKCNDCHANVVDANGAISAQSNHVNKFKNISIILRYKAGQTMYSTTVPAKKTCKNIKCHAGRITPLWGNASVCINCHYATSGAANQEDSFAWTNYTGTATNAVAKIYSAEWVKRGHGKTKASGKYPFSNNSGAGKTCDNCHRSEVKHNQSNYFRIITANGNSAANPDLLCARCHGSGSQLQTGFGRITAIVSHTYVNMSTLGGYKGGTNGKAGWNFTPKCVDCHDPHGDGNNSMLHTYINMTGSDTVGRPTPAAAQTLASYTAIGGQVAWSSFVRNTTYNGICQRCHSAEVDFFDKAQFGSHNNASGPCKQCHKHKKGFSPSGCDSCHGDSTRNMGRANNGPPKGPSGWSDSLTNKSSLHQPHAYNPRSRPGFGNKTGFACERCHDDSLPAGNHNSSKTAANLNNLTSTSGYGGYNSQSKVNYGTGTQNPANDTCWDTKCHTPRAYIRTWQKPKDCDDCHGTIRLRGATERGYKLHTTNSHKIHLNYTGVASPPTAWGKNYRFECSNCHYNVGTNYSTHYSGQVNITSSGPINTVGAAGGFYGRGRSFKGFSTGNDLTATNTACTKVYCHGNFTNGTTTTKPYWKKGQTTVNCGSCHKAKTGKVTNWQNGTSMPARHPKHVRTVTYNFVCSKCHVRTVTNNTTVQFAYSTHVNGTVNVVFDSVSGTFNSSTKSCMTNYCHSRGNTQTAPYSMANYTAEWDQTALAKTGSGKTCSFCHGNKTYGGITAAMPRQATFNSHSTHVLKEKFKCYVCHANVVDANGAIVSYSNHVNKFKNVSIITLYKTGQERYSSTVAAKKTCKNIKCHAGRTTPLWGNTGKCQDCHYQTGGTEDNFAWTNFTGASFAAAKIYSSEWVKFGHGRTGSAYPSSGNAAANKACTNCHVSSVKHNTATNPFRLHTSDSNKVCASCHGSGTGEIGKWGNAAANRTSIVTHSYTATKGNAGWNFGSHLGTDQKRVKCVDCHDPHGDSNRSMVHGLINYTGSNQYGTPSPIAAQVQMVFSTVGANMNWSSFVKAGYNGICQRCHSPSTVDSNMANFSKNLFTNHNNGSKCTNCHSHKAGFKGGGESTGNQNCTGCHTLNTKMSDSGTYHHVIKSVNYNYVNWTLSDGTLKNFTTTSRRCVMCHVDHDDFSPAAAKGTINKRAKNLRVNAVQSRTTGINTDFWPAKRKNAVRTGGDAGSGNYSSTMPVSGPSGSNGVCMSCHDAIQFKNTTNQKDSDGSRRARSFTVALYTSSSHNFQIRSGWNNFGDGSSFRANCSKCHRSDFIDQGAAQTGQKFGLHDSGYPSILFNMTGTAAGKTKIETLCYNCHSTDKYPSSNYDYYSSIKMSSSAKMIKTAIEAKSSGHPLDDAGMAGQHKPDEFYNVTGTVAANSNPPAAKFWNFSTNRHVECVDCHNTHGGNASITRVVGGPFKGRILPAGTYTNYSAGNKVAGAQSGTWGVSLDYAGTTRGQTPKFTKVAQVAKQYELCIKCHSNFAYGANPRGVPSGLPDTTAHMTVPYDILDTTVPQANIAAMINPNNFGFHPIYQKGRNQPGKGLNTNWPAAKSNWMYRDKMTNRTAFISVSGLSWNFVPPYSQHSLLSCSDCHQSDNTGLAIGPVEWNTGLTVNTDKTWTGATGANIQARDGVFARWSSAGASYIQTEIDFAGSYPANQPTNLVLVAYGSSSDPTKNNRNASALGLYSGATNTLIKGTTALLTPYASSASANRIEYNAAIARTWQWLDSNSRRKLRYTTDSTHAAAYWVYIDYIGVEALYPTTSDVRGPHGSLEKWITTDVDKDINFDANNNNTLTDAGDKPNSGFTGNALKIFCWNCHRSDVYYNSAVGGGTASYPNYARIDHSSGTVAEPFDDPFSSTNIKNQWGIACYNCHAGGGVGEIHGSFQNSTTAAWWYPVGGAASRVSMGRPRGVRLMNGAGFAINPSSGACYTPGNLEGNLSAPAPYATGCSGAQHVDGAVSTTFNYTYTAW